MNKSLDATVLRYVGYGLLFLIGAYLLYAVRGTLPIFFVGALLAYAFEPILQRLEKRGYSRRAAVGVIFLFFILLLIVLLALLALAWQQVQSLALNTDVYRVRAETFLTSVRANINARLENVHLSPNIKQSIDQVFDNPQTTIFPAITERIKGAPSLIVSSLGSFFITLVILPIITLSLMMEMNSMRARVMMLVPPVYRRDVTEMAQSINEVLGRYVRGQLIVCTAFGVLCTMAFEFLAMRYGMGYPLILGLLAALVYIIPYIGMATIAVAAGATAYFTVSAPNNTMCALLAVGACVVFNLIIDYGVSPRVLGKGVGLHPLMVIFALLSGAQMGGVPGMILAVPLFASLRVILIYIFPQLTAPVIPPTPPEVDMKRDERTVTGVTSKVIQQIEKAGGERSGEIEKQSA